jgi:hypothetical protein
MSWGLGWKRSSEIFHLTLDYGDYDDTDDHQPSSPPPPASSSPSFSASSTPVSSSSPTATRSGDLGFRIELDWSAGDDEDQVALRLQSQLMVALPPPHDAVSIDLTPMDDGEEEGVRIEMRVVRRREALRSVRVSRAPGSALGSGDGAGVLARLIRSNLAPAPAVDGLTAAAGVPVLADHWRPVAMLSLCNCGMSVSSSFTTLPLIQAKKIPISHHFHAR